MLQANITHIKGLRFVGEASNVSGKHDLRIIGQAMNIAKRFCHIIILSIHCVYAASGLPRTSASDRPDIE